jgi:hypothetical protein
LLKNDGNVGRDHWLICHEHKYGWWIGSNLFSGWREETEKQWEENKTLLSTYSEPSETVNDFRNTAMCRDIADGEKPPTKRKSCGHIQVESGDYSF